MGDDKPVVLERFRMLEVDDGSTVGPLIEEKPVQAQEEGQPAEISINPGGDLDKRVLKRNEFLDIVAYADALQRFDSNRGDQRFIDSIVGPTSSGEDLPISTVYEIAEELQIPKRYVDRALAMRHPSVDQQLADIGRFGASPSIGVVSSIYEKTLLERLKEDVPTDRFTVARGNNPYYPSIGFYSVESSTERRRGLFGSRVENVVRNHPLADLNFISDIAGHVPRGTFGLGIKLQDPLFLRVCGETLSRLHDQFRSKMNFYNLFYFYQVK